ncbi:MAG: DUF6069 family protein [Anaerolineales bacterium]|jgi:hypothetical protein
MGEASNDMNVDRKVDLDIWRAGIVAFFASVLSNVLAHYLLSFILVYPRDFIPLRLTWIAILTGTAALGATLLFALLHGRVEDPGPVFKRLGLVLLGLSILPSIFGALRPDLFSLPGSTSSGFLMLIPFHLIAGVVIIGLLSQLQEG